ncbi:phasin family protein [Candidatus Enterovibrio escicola]|uniref:Phasin domain-containing protein n=1 Tax=Candidatus Enterovibrio escicola TaxID=1927127 RepID=A0A2A5SZY6_9GAMM|nr:phasin family protein [Candidatus Enterovibrio escacola]PCS21489.1 hypothetical protein BTN49_3029 [Candidatus Enterovibrio escacola]
MYTDMFKAFSEQTEKTLAPYVKFNKMVAKNAITMAELQLNAVRTYSEMGLAQMKAASNVTDITSLTAFSSQQLAALSKLSQQMMEDSTKMQTISKEFKEDLEKLTTENIKAATPA